MQKVSTVEDPRNEPDYDKTLGNTISRSTALGEAESPLIESKK